MLAPLNRFCHRTANSRLLLPVVMTLLFLVGSSTSCGTNLKAVDNNILSALIEEHHEINETCTVLQSHILDVPNHALNEHGRNALGQEYLETALTLAKLVDNAVAALKGQDPTLPQGFLDTAARCSPQELEDSLIAYAYGESTKPPEEIEEHLATCSQFFLETVPNALRGRPLAPSGTGVESPAATWLKLVNAMADEGVDPRALLKNPSSVSDVVDLSIVVTNAVVRLGYLFHERVDSLGNSVPYRGGLLGAIAEQIGAELFAIMADRLVDGLERKQWVQAADVGRRACVLLERESNHPVIVYRTLVRLVQRFRYDPALDGSGRPSSPGGASTDPPPVDPSSGARSSRRNSKPTKGKSLATIKNFRELGEVCGHELRKECEKIAKDRGLEIAFPPSEPECDPGDPSGSGRVNRQCRDEWNDYGKELEAYIKRWDDTPDDGDKAKNKLYNDKGGDRAININDWIPTFRSRTTVRQDEGGRVFLEREPIAGIDTREIDPESLSEMEAMLQSAAAACASPEECSQGIINRQLGLFVASECTYKGRDSVQEFAECLAKHTEPGEAGGGCIECCDRDTGTTGVVEPDSADTDVIVVVDASVSVIYNPDSVSALLKMGRDMLPWRGQRDLRINRGASIFMDQSCTYSPNPRMEDKWGFFAQLRSDLDELDQQASNSTAAAARLMARRISTLRYLGKPDEWGTPMRTTMEKSIGTLIGSRARNKRLILVTDGYATCFGHLTQEPNLVESYEVEKAAIRALLIQARDNGIAVSILFSGKRDIDAGVSLKRFCGDSSLALECLEHSNPAAIASLRASIVSASCRIPAPASTDASTQLYIGTLNYGGQSPQHPTNPSPDGWYFDALRGEAVLTGTVCHALLTGGTARFDQP